MKKFIILTRKGKLDCRVLLEESEQWLGREAIEVNNRESNQRLALARINGEGVFEDKNNSIIIRY